MFSNSNIVGQQPVTPIAANGSITTANVSQTILAANPLRGGMNFTNTSNTVMYIEFTGAAATTLSLPIYPNQLYEPSFSTVLAVNVICDTATATYNCSYWNGSMASGVTTIVANLTPATSSSATVNSTITTGGTAQVVVAANASRKYFEFYNNSAVIMYLSITTAGVALSGIPVAAGAGYWSPPVVIASGQINVMCSLTLAKYTYIEYL
jgi:hypothetical protein